VSKSSLLRQRISRRRALKYLATATAGGLAAACGGRSEETSTPESATPQVQEPAPGQGGTIVWFDVGDPASFDYYKTWTYRTNQFAALVYPRLLKFKIGPDVTPLRYDVVPDLAVAMPEQPDATTYIFKLRPARWEDKAPLSARPLTSEDVVKNWERFRVEHPFRAVFQDVDRVEAPAADTVRFVLSRPLGSFLNQVGHHGFFYIMPYELFGTGRLEQDMWSAGPFLFRGYQIGSDVRFERNPNYYIPNRPLASSTVCQIIPDRVNAFAQFRVGRIDATCYREIITAKELSEARSAVPDATFIPYDAHLNSWLGFDLTDPVFQDKRVRQAISMAINRDDLVRTTDGGSWVLPWGILDAWHFDPAKNEFPNARYYQHNPQEARALLRAAGYERLGPYDLLFARVRSEQADYAQLIQQQLQQVGVETRLKELPLSEFNAQVQVGGRWRNAMAVGYNIVGSDPNEYLFIFWHPASPRVISPGLQPLLSNDSELMGAIDRQARENDYSRRREALRNVVNIMADRMYNAPLAAPRFVHVHQRTVHQFHWIFSYGGEYLLDAFKA